MVNSADVDNCVYLLQLVSLCIIDENVAVDHSVNRRSVG